ncbi:Hypothetical predicted protein, partial [Paramuricea clavata]
YSFRNCARQFAGDEAITRNLKIRFNYTIEKQELTSLDICERTCVTTEWIVYDRRSCGAEEGAQLHQ